MGFGGILLSPNPIRVPFSGRGGHGCLKVPLTLSTWAL